MTFMPHQTSSEKIQSGANPGSSMNFAILCNGFLTVAGS
jgi:hypothetical protein